VWLLVHPGTGCRAGSVMVYAPSLPIVAVRRRQSHDAGGGLPVHRDRGQHRRGGQQPEVLVLATLQFPAPDRAATVALAGALEVSATTVGTRAELDHLAPGLGGPGGRRRVGAGRWPRLAFASAPPR
jgi:hypothetical protein